MKSVYNTIYLDHYEKDDSIDSVTDNFFLNI